MYIYVYIYMHIIHIYVYICVCVCVYICIYTAPGVSSLQDESQLNTHANKSLTHEK